MSAPRLKDSNQARIVANLLKEGKVTGAKREMAISSLREFYNRSQGGATPVSSPSPAKDLSPAAFFDAQSGKKSSSGENLGHNTNKYEEAQGVEDGGFLSVIDPFDHGIGPTSLPKGDHPEELSRRFTPDGTPGVPQEKWDTTPDSSGWLNPITRPIRYFWNNKVGNAETKSARNRETRALKAQGHSGERDYTGKPIIEGQRVGAGKPQLNEDDAQFVYELMSKYSKAAEGNLRSHKGSMKFQPGLMPWDDTVGGWDGPTVGRSGKFNTSDDGSRIVVTPGIIAKPQMSLVDFVSYVMTSPPEEFGKSAPAMARFKADLEGYFNEEPPEIEESTSTELPPQSKSWFVPKD
jgi:hypothetical protein